MLNQRKSALMNRRCYSQRRGLVLLVVLGMLGLFSLLAVSYMVFAGQSRTAGLRINQAKLRTPMNVEFNADIIPLILRGSSSNFSALARHSLLGDVYGRHAMEGNMRNYQGGYRGLTMTDNTLYQPPNAAVIVGRSARPTGGASLQSDATFVKLSLDNTGLSIRDFGAGDLSVIDDTYNGHIFTMIEGPLSGYSFRILKYIGNEPDSGNTQDDPLEYSILIDLAELPKGVDLTGDVTGQAMPFSGTVNLWVQGFPNALFYGMNGEPYRFLINDAVYNGVGYGLDPVTGTLTQQVVDPVAGAPMGIPASLLPAMDYLGSTNLVDNNGTIQTSIGGGTNEGIDVADYRDFWLANVNPDGDLMTGGVNPLKLIPSYHRPELINYIANAYGAKSGGAFNSSTLNIDQLRQMLLAIDFATARPLPISIDNGSIAPNRLVNRDFEAGRIKSLNIISANWPAQSAQVDSLLSTLVGFYDADSDGTADGSAYDVDNDGDGIADSVWIDPDLPLVTAPDGRTLKVMTAIHIVDLDGRINMNLAGDTTQAFPLNSYTAATELLQSVKAPGALKSQGSGAGPGELGLIHLLSAGTFAERLAYVRRIMTARNGNDNAANATYNWTGVPGRVLDTAGTFNIFYNTGNDYSSALLEHGLAERNYQWFNSNVSPRGGLPLLLRSHAGYGLDRFGNISTYAMQLQDPSNNAFDLDQLTDDPYELSQNPQAGDSPFTLEELERILRRFDADVGKLSDRLLNIVKLDTGWSLTSEVNHVITTRSHELRNMPLGYPGPNTFDPTLGQQRVVSLFEWVMLLYEQHYRRVNSGTPTQNDPAAVKSGTDDFLNGTSMSSSPPLKPDILKALFPIEFRHGLRMNLNRPFGNGFDNNSSIDFDSDGNTDTVVVDDPSELFNAVDEREPYMNFTGATAPIGQYDNVNWVFDPTSGTNGGFIYPFDGKALNVGSLVNHAVPPTPATAPLTNPPGPPYRTPYATAFNFSLASRQLYARQLYCLAQLLVPQDYQFSTMLDLNPSTLDNGWYKRRARTLAQWAVNVVDFRDQDSVMTRFEYDYLPFGIRAGVTGVNHTPASAFGYGKDPGWEPEEGDVVWGMEFPELLLSESFAMHDKRVIVTQRNSSDPMQSLPAQMRIPQGSAFIELVNPRTFSSGRADNLPAVPKDLYFDVNNNVNNPLLALNVAQWAPADTANYYGPQPVWRIGVTAPTGQPGAPTLPYDQVIDDPASTTKGLYSNQTSETSNSRYNGMYSDFSNPTNQIEFERVVFLTHNLPSTYGVQRLPNVRDGATNIDNRVFFNRRTTGGGANPAGSYLPLGGYLTIAPRIETIFGSRVYTDPNFSTPPIYQPSQQMLRANANNIEQIRIDGTTANSTLVTMGTNIRADSVVQIAQAEPPSPAWRTTPAGHAPYSSILSPTESVGVGLNVSEPLPVPGQYYTQPTTVLNSADTAGYADTNRPADAYQDLSNTGANLDTTIFDDDSVINPILTGANQAGTYADFRTLYLQRLANPSVPYDPVWNPYITIDTMSIDLTIFTGEDDNQDYAGTGVRTFALEPRFKDGRSMDSLRTASVNTNPLAPPQVVTPPTTFGENTKSYFSASTAPLWETRPDLAQATNVNLNYELGYPLSTAIASSATFGYLNMGHTNDGTTFDGFGLPVTSIGSATAEYMGTPDPNRVTMTGLAWFNRDFANPYELMLVPFTAPGQFAASYTTSRGLTTPANMGAPINVYDSPVPGATSYGYLFNFFGSNEREAGPLPSPVRPAALSTDSLSKEPYWMHQTLPWGTTGRQSDLSLLLELVETTPRYAESVEFINPLATSPNIRGAASDPSLDGSYATQVDSIRNRMLTDFISPYAKRPTYTNPGLININTALSEAVWKSIDFNMITDSAKRISPVGDLTWDQVRQSRRGYPITSNIYNSNIDDRIPTQFAGAFRSQFTANITPQLATGNETLLRANQSVSTTFRRSSSSTPNASVTDQSLLTSQNLESAGEINASAAEIVASPLNTYQRFGRLENLVTEQSNVYAIWITVGLFEFDPVLGLGKEYVGTDGMPKRQRSFYIVDRTVPVAYREGDNFNTEKVILLRRSIAR